MRIYIQLYKSPFNRLIKIVREFLNQTYTESYMKSQV